MEGIYFLFALYSYYSSPFLPKGSFLSQRDSEPCKSKLTYADVDRQDYSLKASTRESIFPRPR